MKMRYVLFALLIPIMVAPRAARAQAQSTRPAPSQAAAFDPVGSYDLLFDASGHQQPGELTIVKSKEGKLTGSLSLHGHVIPLESITQEKGKPSFTANAPDGHFTITLSASGTDELKGTFATQEMSGTLTAVRRK